MRKAILPSLALIAVTSVFLTACQQNTAQQPIDLNGKNAQGNSQATVNIIDNSASREETAIPANQGKTEEKIQKKTTSSNIDITYPLSGNQLADQDLKTTMEQQVANFEQLAEDPLPADAGYTNALIGKYEKTRYSDQIISIKMSFSEFTGGAHPNTYYVTKTYDLGSGKSLNLSDLFTPGSDYLKQLSTLSSAQLIANSEYLQGLPADQRESDDSTRWIKEGTAATEDNFRSWGLEGKTLNIYFPPYQVASYAEGEHQVKIPLSEFKKLSSVLK
jgi:hypothetical protein